MTVVQSDSIRCRDECGAAASSPDEAANRGWTQLDVAGGWRCGPCFRALRAAGAQRGTDGTTADTLPPQSRGALPRETASTITPPSFRG